MFERSPEKAKAIAAIIMEALNDDSWSGIRVAFGHDEPAVVSVDLLLEHDQIMQLAELARVEIDPPHSAGPFDTSLENNLDELRQYRALR
jgi:hypothetical protein